MIIATKRKTPKRALGLIKLKDWKTILLILEAIGIFGIIGFS